MNQSSHGALPNLNDAIRKALKDWHDLDSQTESPLAHLYLLRKAWRDGYKPIHRATNQVLLETLELLQQTHEQDAKLLQMRFLDLWPIHRLANHFNVAESTLYTQQRQALEQLTGLLINRENAAHAKQKEHLLRCLEPATYVELIGVEAQIDQLMTPLKPEKSPWLISIEGIGGIGKTSLADALLRRIIEEGVYDEIAWVSARQARFNFGGALTAVEQPALTTEMLVEALARQLLGIGISEQIGLEALVTRLRSHLKQTPHLIVIDNLETVLDIESLLPTLQGLTNPTKFLLTSRFGLYSTPNIYHFTVAELSEAHALALIRKEATLSNLPVLATCSDDVLRRIYALTGGNPLALRLIVGQNHFYTLESILSELHTARGQTIENLYTYIYRSVWDSLDDVSQDVLLIMPLVNPHGDEMEVIAEIGEMELGTVRMALNRLVTYNLVDARGGINDRRYSIHGLTRTFLHEQAIRWQQ